MLRELILKNRTCRRFYEDHKVERKDLESFVDLARLSASASNLQPLKYFLSCDPDTNSLIFPHLSWAGYLNNWPGPPQGERPSAYIAVLLDTGISKGLDCDHGIAAQSISLGAAEMGLGCCIISSIKRKDLQAALNIPDLLKILLVIAIGKPREKVFVESVGASGDVKYWRDEKKGHHVPKRQLMDIIINDK